MDTPAPNSSGSHKWEINDLATLRAAHAGQALALNQRYLNRQLGRVLQTLGFDREWVRGEGPYLIDNAGESYLDLYAGYGVFGLGRNHPFVKAQLHALLDSDPPSLPQLGVSTLAGLLAQRLVELAPASIDAAVLTSSGTEAVEGPSSSPGRPPDAHGSSTASGGFTGSPTARCRSMATTSSASTSPPSFRAAIPCRLATSTRSRLSSIAAMSPASSSSLYRARASIRLPTAT